MKHINVIFGGKQTGKSTIAKTMALAYRNVKTINGANDIEFEKGMKNLEALRNEEKIEAVIVDEVQEVNIKRVIKHFFYNRSKLHDTFSDEKTMVLIVLQSASDAFLKKLPFNYYESCDFLEAFIENDELFRVEKLQFEVNRIK